MTEPGGWEGEEWDVRDEPEETANAQDNTNDWSRAVSTASHSTQEGHDSLIVHADNTRDFEDVEESVDSAANTSGRIDKTPSEKHIKTEHDEKVHDSLIVHVDDTRDLDEELEDSAISTSPRKSVGGKNEATLKERDQKDDKKERKEEKHESKDSKASKTAKSSDSKSTNENGSSANGDASERNVWVSGLGEGTRASDLQAIFKNYGKVVGAKIITNTKNPGSGLFGLITMETKEQAQECIQKLNKTELNGKTILVEKNRPADNSGKKVSEKHDKEHRSRDRRSRSRDKDRKDKSRRRSRSSDRKRRSRSRSPRSRRPIRPVIRGPPPPRRPFVPGREPRITPAELRRIEQERLMKRRERIIQENEMRRRMEDERRQRELDREKEKLRIERERLEKEKAELLRLERERARMERERIEREKEELRRRLTREEDLRRGPPPPVSVSIPIGPAKRPYDDRDAYWDKRAVMPPDPMTVSARVPYDSGSTLASTAVVPSRFDAYDSRGQTASSSDRFGPRANDGYRDSRDSSRDSSRHVSERDDRRGMVPMSSYYDRGQTRGLASTSGVGPATGSSVYSATSSAPLGPSSVIGHQSSAPLGPQSMDRSYVHSSIRRF